MWREPVIMLSTIKGKQPNVMTMSWHTMMEFEPPLVGCIVSDRNYSFNLLKSSKECVINIPTFKIAKKVIACGNCSGREVNKFEKFGLTQVKASVVKAPLVAECYVNLECRLVDTAMVKKYGLFVLQVVRAWIDPSVKNPRTIHHRGGEEFMVAGKTVKIKSRMK